MSHTLCTFAVCEWRTGAGPTRYRSRRSRQAARFTRGAFRWRDGQLWLAKAHAPLRLVWSWPQVDPALLAPTGVTISRDPNGRWYATRHVQVTEPAPRPTTGRAVGIDLGISDFAVAKVARAHRKVRAARADFLQRVSTRLVRDHDLIVIEDLNVKGMTANRRPAKAIEDCGWGTFRGLLAYKAQRAGRRLLVIDRWYPSSKICSSCGLLLATLSLGTRTWACPVCGARHDRDHNAAKNIPAAGRAVSACGADTSHPGSSRVQSALKQEPQRATAGIPALSGRE